MSKTRKRVLSVLTILFAVALVFTACFVLAGCGDSEETKPTTTVTGTKLTITGSGVMGNDYQPDPSNPWIADGSWAYQYAATLDQTNATQTKEGTVYLWVIQNGELLFGLEDDYSNYISMHMSAGTNGTWTYTEGTFAVDFGNNESAATDNNDGSVTITVTSGNYGTYVATINLGEVTG